jgi:hypothetical protein
MGALRGVCVVGRCRSLKKSKLASGAAGAAHTLALRAAAGGLNSAVTGALAVIEGQCAETLRAAERRSAVRGENMELAGCWLGCERPKWGAKKRRCRFVGKRWCVCAHAYWRGAHPGRPSLLSPTAPMAPRAL